MMVLTLARPSVTMQGMQNPYFAVRAKLGGTDASVARAFGRTRQAIARWKRAGVPLSLAFEAQTLTAGEVRAEDILRYASLKS